jgi:hypothetical protein
MRSLFEAHPAFKERRLKHRRFKHRDIVALLDGLPFNRELIGTSYEGRSITKVKLGKGSRRVLLWSQMHGDEATATMALFDILRFFHDESSEFASIRDTILEKLEIHLVPMLNPDGAERFQRRTAQEIDMNRDALALQCPESRLLKQLVMELRPEFSFNLHDQSNYYAVGDSGLQTTVAFLATAYNEERAWNDNRTKSAQVISAMNSLLQKRIPGRVAKFSDEFEPRAFGDNIQRWGSSLILVESGAFTDDVEKQFVRALNFEAILEGLYSIASDSYTSYSIKDYEDIPENNRVLLDLKIKNLAVGEGEKQYTVEVGTSSIEKNGAGAKKFVRESVIEEIGDLSVFHGIEEWDANGGIFRSVLEYPEWMKLYKIRRPMKHLQLGESATFVVDHGETQTLILNGKIV